MAVKPPALVPGFGHGRPRAAIITGTILIGAAGAVTSYVCEQVAASTAAVPGIVKTAAETGRYTVTFLRKYRNVRVFGAPCIIGPTDAGLTGTDGNQAIARNVSGAGFDIQAISSAHADANPANGNSIHFAVEVQL